jgi:hypothetical protein
VLYAGLYPRRQNSSALITGHMILSLTQYVKSITDTSNILFMREAMGISCLRGAKTLLPKFHQVKSAFIVKNP